VGKGNVKFLMEKTELRKILISLFMLGRKGKREGKEPLPGGNTKERNHEMGHLKENWSEDLKKREVEGENGKKDLIVR